MICTPNGTTVGTEYPLAKLVPVLAAAKAQTDNAMRTNAFSLLKSADNLLSGDSSRTF